MRPTINIVIWAAMGQKMLIFQLVVIMAVTYFFTVIYRYYALRNNILDLPNARSSHSLATPRGGGCVFVIVAILSYAIFRSAAFSVADLGLFLGASVVAIVGFWDDRVSVPAKVRLCAHFAAAGCFMTGYIYSGAIAGVVDIGIPVVGVIGLVVVFIVWMTNLFNFMDGIDGLAASQIIFVCTGMAIIYRWSDLFGLALLPLVLASSVIGFLIINFPPAKIFMGDAGSGFLGFVCGGLAIQGLIAGSDFFVAWLILCGVFIVDTTLTLVVRILRGDRFYEAHRTHAYQHATQRFKRHSIVTIGVVTINVCWLLPWAFLVATGTVNSLVGLFFAYFPLLMLALKFRAGLPS